jgi:hypothetical protein
MTKNPQSRKWQITINNPAEKKFCHERIKIELQKLKSIIYWCMGDEIGAEEETPHTHLYIACSSAVRFSTLKSLFNSAHLERAKGTSQENRDYIEKSGKWENDEKSETKIPDTFEEWGEMPIESKGGISIESIIIERVLDGASNAEILREFPHYLRGMRDVENIRQMLKAEENREKWRDIETTYIWGTTGAGKTRYVMEKHGYSSVYAINDYKHPFDGYAGENVLLFDEFNSGIRIQSMNNYLDGYPLSLPARYSNKQACFERVYIISNLDLRLQYRHEQSHQSEVWAAFLRRIHNIIRYMPDGSRREYTTKEYFSDESAFSEVSDNVQMPF